MNRSANAPARRRGTIAAILAAFALALAFAAPASAEFGFTDFDVQFNELDATPGIPFDDPPATQAGSHPFAVTTYFGLNYTEKFPGEILPFAPDERIKDLIIEQVPGLSGDATAIPRCSSAAFAEEGGAGIGPCDRSTQIGVAALGIGLPELYFLSPITNLEPPPGAAVRLGFWILGVPTIVDVGIKPGGEYNVRAVASRLTSQVIPVLGSVIQLWGVPADPAHDSVR
ncbi:MAG: hypothetical protein WA687_12755, partial [Solirubrobacterales bacterium]